MLCDRYKSFNQTRSDFHGGNFQGPQLHRLTRPDSLAVLKELLENTNASAEVLLFHNAMILFVEVILRSFSKLVRLKLVCTCVCDNRLAVICMCTFVHFSHFILPFEIIQYVCFCLRRLVAPEGFVGQLKKFNHACLKLPVKKVPLKMHALIAHLPTWYLRSFQYTQLL